jgi:hypothetical protein
MTTTTLVVAVPTIAVLMSYWAARRKIEQIHILVNSRLSDALSEIRSLKKELGRPPDDL